MEGVKCLWSHAHPRCRKRDVGRKEMRRNECACLCELQLEAEGGEEGSYWEHGKEMCVRPGVYGRLTVNQRY